MESNWIILSLVSFIVVVLMIFIIRENLKDKKTYEDDLNRPSNLYDDESEDNDVD